MTRKGSGPVSLEDFLQPDRQGKGSRSTRSHVRDKFVVKRHCGGNVDLQNFFGSQLFKDHDNGPQAVPVGHHEAVFSLEEGRKDFALKIGKDPLGCRLEAFSARRADIVAASPDVNLFGTELLGRFILVQPLKVTVMAFIQCRCFHDREIMQARRFLNDSKGFLGPLEHGRECPIKGDSGEIHSRPSGFFPSQVGQVDIDPSGETIFKVPLALSMADEYQFAQFMGGKGLVGFDHRILVESGSMTVSRRCFPGGPVDFLVSRQGAGTVE